MAEVSERERDDDMPDLGLGGDVGSEDVLDEDDNDEDEMSEEDLEDMLMETMADEVETAKEEQTTMQTTFDSLPRKPDGTVDVDVLTMEQRKLYNAQVMSLLTENQMDRYECFRRSSLKEPMRKLIQVVVGGGNPKSTDKIVIAMAGVTKVYVGEIIEHARKIAEARGEHGPLTPEMIYEAYTVVSSHVSESSKPKTRTLRL